MSASADHSPLGKAVRYADQYDPALLVPIPRAPQRAQLGMLHLQVRTLEMQKAARAALKPKE